MQKSAEKVEFSCIIALMLIKCGKLFSFTVFLKVVHGKIVENFLWITL